MGTLIQPPAPVPGIVAPQATGTANSLDSVLSKLYWSVQARGPLLVVGAEKYTLVPEPKPLDFFSAGMGGMFGGMGNMAELMGQKKTPPPALEPTPREGWNPTVLAPRFGGQLVRCGTVTVFAPLLLPDTTKKNDPFGGQDMAELMQEGMAMGMGGSRLLPLLASLTPSQVTQASSTAGLPLASLDKNQRALLQPLMRRTLTFRFAQKPNLPPATPLDPAPLIPQADQNQFRLRLSRSLSITPQLQQFTASGGGPRMAMRLGNLVEEKNVGESRALALKPGKQLNPLAMLSILGMGGNDKGTPARRKPSDLNPDSGALNARVSLEGVSTVEALVSRISTVTKVSLFADQRIGKLKVSVRGTSARAGDLIEALCWAVGGAVRRISDDREAVFLLTEQAPLKTSANPIAIMMPAITGMMQDQKSAERKAVDARIRLIRQRTLAGISRGTGAEFGEQFWRIAEARPTPEGNLIPAAELSPDVLKQAQERYNGFATAIAAIPDGTPGITKPTQGGLTHVRCGQELVAELVAPTLGAVATLTTTDANEIHPELPVPAPPPAVGFPETLKQRVLSVALPETAALAEALVESASTHGITELRVSVPASGERALATLAAAAKGKVGVVAVLSPLEPLTSEAPRDRSWAGQTFPEWFALPESKKMMSDLPPQLAPFLSRMFAQDFLTPESADVASFVARTKRLLALPGVTGFALERLAAPGYREGIGGMGGAEGFFWQGGANARERVAFVRDQKSDPAELGGFSFTDIFSGGSVRSAWTKRTTVRSDAFLGRLTAGLTKSGLTPVSVLTTAEPPRWEKWTGKYPGGSTINSAIRPVLKTLSYSRILAQPGQFGDASEFAGFDDPDQFTGVLGKELKSLNAPDADVRWDGLVLDLADQTVETTLALLERALVKK